MGILKSILTWGETEKQKKRRLKKEARDDAERERRQESDARHQKEMDKITAQSFNTDRYTKY